MYLKVVVSAPLNGNVRPMATRIGDIYAVEVAPGRVKVFHHVVNDATQLGSNVIRAFTPVISADSLPEQMAALDGEVDFYAHTLCALGIKLGFWRKVGHQKPHQEVTVWFRDSNDYGNPNIKVSNDWWVWKVGQKSKRIGPLSPQYKNSEIGIVFSAPAIVSRLRTGNYGIVYPAYE